jgi:mRNA interferase RelE/StbE
MMYEVILSPTAADFFAAADRPVALKLSRCFRQLESNPRLGNNIKRLKGDWSGYFRYRVGDWRVVYRIDDDARHVNVVVIAHRREVYE